MSSEYDNMPFHSMRVIIKYNIKSIHILKFCFIYLLLAWISFFFVDVYNVLGLRDVLVGTNVKVPITWVFFFKEAGLTEMLQWLALLLATIVSIGLSIMLKKQSYFGAASFWRIMGIATFLMFIEDGLNPRHILANLMITAFSTLDPLRVRIITELCFFTILAAVPVYAVLRYWRYPWKSIATRNYLFLGFISYAAAVGSSGTRFIFDWYYYVGHNIHETIAKGELLVPYYWNRYWLDHHLVDWLIEESVELIGAGALFAAAVAYLWDFKRGKINY